MYQAILQAQQLTEEISTAALKARPIYQIRFDRHESPAVINGGDGWTERQAKDWLARRELATALEEAGDYLRARQGKATGSDMEITPIDVGVVILRCK